jgi:hypothetical protein
LLNPEHSTIELLLSGHYIMKSAPFFLNIPDVNESRSCHPD